MPHERLRPEFNKKEAVGIEEKFEEIQRLYPEAIADGKINFDTLKELLGARIEEGDEHFGLFWPGKREARKMAVMPSKGTLAPCLGEGINEDTTGNIFIEGENLEVLKILQKSYAGKIKMIYIDPPYNTGNDFVYDDNYTEPLEDYLKRTGQIDGEGRPLTTNTKADGRFHSKWLSMMYPRLRLARNLLRDDGSIFISIDENEVHHLRKLCDEVFGEDNFISLITLLCNPKGRSQDKYFATNHEYILIYSKNNLPKGSFSIEKEEQQIIAEYPEEDDLGKYRLLELRNTHRDFGKHNRKNLFYPFYIDPQTEKIYLQEDKGRIEVLPIWDDGFEGCWTWDKIKADCDSNYLVGKKVQGKWKIFRKSYASGSERMLKTILSDKALHTEKGQKAFNDLFNNKSKIFQSPKSIELIKLLSKTNLDRNDIILDFFSGSGSTAHAVIDLNNEDGGDRQFIIVQIPENTDENSEAYKLGYKTISEISKERVRRVIKKAKLDDTEKLNYDSKIDLGFKVFKLCKSNFKEWINVEEGDVKQLQGKFDSYEESLRDRWNADDLITEIMLMEGFPLESIISKIEAIKKNKVYQIKSNFAPFNLIICLDKLIKPETIDILNISFQSRFICLDSAIDDTHKMQLADRCILKTI